METPKNNSVAEPPRGGAKAARLICVMAPDPDFLPPLEGESAMLLHLLGLAFTDLIKGA